MAGKSVNASIDIDAPPEEVWDVVMDPKRLGDWVTIHRKLGKVSDDPLKQGSRLEQTLCLRGANFKVRWEVEGYDEGRRATWEGRGPARSHATTEYDLRPDGNGGTRFGYTNAFKAPLGPLGSVASRAVMGGVPEREAKKSLAKLKALVEKD
jgi:carbon monoxide dehydrogenase subunit G